MAVIDLKKSTIKTGNTVSTFITNLTEFNNKVIYGKSQVPPVIDFSDPLQRNTFISDIKTFLSDPSLCNATFILQNLNSYDLCNPFMFAVSQAFPPGSGVANAFTRIQSKINGIVDAFESFSITDGVKQANATARTSLDPASTADLAFGGGGGVISIPFQEEKIFLNIETTDTISNGANITITQLEDDKIKTSMVGQVEQVVQANNNTKTVSINVNNVFPPQVPVEEDGTTPKTFRRFKVEYETKTSTDIRQLSEDLQGLTETLRSIGVIDIAVEINELPDFIPGVSKIKAALSNISPLLEAIGSEANITGTAGDVLAGNINAEEVIRRVRILRDFYAKIRPYTNLNFAITSFFEDEIEGINRFLRNAIPYEALASLVGFVVNIARTILGIINYIIGLLKIISSIIKVITVILKVLKIAVKILKIVIKVIPSTFLTVGKHEKAINGVGAIENAIGQAIDTLEGIQWGVDAVIRQLQLTKFYLELFVREGAKLQATLESCPGLNGSNLDTVMNQANRNNFLALKTLLDTIPILNSGGNLGNNGTGGNNFNTASTYVTTEGGSIIVLTDTVFGYDEQGNIVFYGDLVSLSTGVNFETTLGQEFRSKLKYYTFNKFKNLDSAGNLIQKAEKLFLQQQTTIADPNDVFGNFAELYQGYTLKIQEEKRTDNNSQVLLRRRAIALDSNEKIVASTELTFSTDLSGLVQELKIKINKFIQQGILGVNTVDKDPNEISDEDAINLAESLGANPIGVNNLKANNADNSISEVTGNPIPTGGITGVGNVLAGIDGGETVETRIGNEPFSSPTTNDINTTVQGVPVNTTTNAEMQVTGNNSPTSNQKVNLESITTNSLNQFINENPSLKGLQETFSALTKISPSQLSAILSQPGAENLSEEELVTNIKVQILTELDPNPEKIEEVHDQTTQFLEALEEVVRAEWEAATANMPPHMRISFEEYYDRVEKDKLAVFIKGLIRKGYTEDEIQFGLSKGEIKEKYKIVIDGTKVSVSLRSRR